MLLSAADKSTNLSKQGRFKETTDYITMPETHLSEKKLLTV